jgi:hypothetical protein
LEGVAVKEVEHGGADPDGGEEKVAVGMMERGFAR